MPDGKRAKAPCGHDGEHVVGQYVRCDVAGCDGVPEHVDPEATPPYIELFSECPKCGSDDVEPFIVSWGPARAHCLPCGHVW